MDFIKINFVAYISELFKLEMDKVGVKSDKENKEDKSK